MNAGGCVQIANPFSDCVGGGALPTSVAVITEHGTWNSFRVGMSAQTMIYERWKLSGEVAYVPYTKFSGFGDHILRDLVFDEHGHGNGVQAEGFLTYMVTEAFSLGVGGRYWALRTTHGTDAVLGTVSPRNDPTGPTGPASPSRVPTGSDVECWGLFVRVSPMSVGQTEIAAERIDLP